MELDSGFIRFRAPIDPFLVMFAALFALDVAAMFTGRPARQETATAT